MGYFFAKYIVIDELMEEMDGLDLSAEQRLHLSSLIDSSLHHAILDEILSNLNNDDKKEFLKKIHQDSKGAELMEFLKPKIENIEDKIKNVSKQLIDEMHKDIKGAKKL